MQNLTNEQLKAKSKEYKNGMLEGGEGFNAYENEIERREVIEAREEYARLEAEWTLEVTKERRIAFNARKPTGRTLAKIQNELGFTFSDLKKAVDKHGL